MQNIRFSMKLEKHVHVLKREQKLLEMHLLNQPNFRQTQKELGNDFNQINWMKRKGHFWELCELWNQKFHWNLPPKTSMNESCKQRANLWKILIEGFKMSHPVLPGSPPLPPKVIRDLLMLCTRILFLSVCCGKGIFSFLLKRWYLYREIPLSIFFGAQGGRIRTNSGVSTTSGHLDNSSALKVTDDNLIF